MTQQTPRLTAAAIVDAAVVIADRDGLNALSMRRIADELGVGAMSLYRHIADKDALMAAMAAEVGSRFPYPVDSDPDLPWRQRVTMAVDIDWALFARHPWVVLAYSVPRYGYGDDSLAGMEWLAQGLRQLGVDEAQAVEMVLTLWNFVNGVALVGVSEQILRSDAREPDSGGLGELLSGRAGAGDRLSAWPVLASLAGHADVGARLGHRAVLDAGVTYLCNGFEAAAR